MPSEPLPWDRKDFFKERRQHDRSELLRGGPRWREPPPRHHYGSSRWVPADFRPTRGAPPGKFFNLLSLLLPLNLGFLFCRPLGQFSAFLDLEIRAGLMVFVLDL